jgi:hypothetical protein
MVKAGKIERVKKGVFRYINAKQFLDNFNKARNQQSLF